MKVIQAPDTYECINEISCFMAGGMGNTEWHTRFLNELDKLNATDLVIYNPYNENITSNFSQIQWEFNYLNSCDIFSVYFDKYTNQPISMSELGRMITLAPPHSLQLYKDGKLFKTVPDPDSGKPCIVSLHEEAPLKEDIKIQCGLLHILALVRTPEHHAELVYKRYVELKAERFLNERSRKTIV